MYDILCVPYLVCWGPVSETHSIRTQDSHVPAARVKQHVTSAASRSAYGRTSCVDPHVIHISTSPPTYTTPQMSAVKMEFCCAEMDPLESSQWPPK
jgi:hypothetical protein